MTRRLFSIVVVALLSTAAATPAQGADWFKEAWSSVCRDFKRRQCWPKPFVCPDRGAIRAPLALMVHNGWRRQNMLGEYHFEQDGQLTEAGRLKVQWIVTEAPRHHRLVYVQKALRPDQTAARLATVQESVASIVTEGPVRPVLITDIYDVGAPAERVDLIGRKYQDTMPDPRLPAPQGDGDN